jgi:dihydropteroate synthase
VGALIERLEQGRRARGAALMGVLNVTPDSFYDGGRYLSGTAAAEKVDRMLSEGADIVDIGGESSRPGSESVPPSEQIARIEGAVRHALSRGAVVSIDTTSPEVADRMLRLGAHLINDVSCLDDTDLARVCAHHGAALLIMHSRGPMASMAGFSVYPDDAYDDVVTCVAREWRAARDRAVQVGMDPDRVFCDPGIGFGKNARHSFELLHGLERFKAEGATLVVGPSRKSFIRAVDEAPPEARLGGSIAACLLAVEKGADLLRVHDVRDVHQALRVARAVRRDPSMELGHA